MDLNGPGTIWRFQRAYKGVMEWKALCEYLAFYRHGRIDYLRMCYTSLQINYSLQLRWTFLSLTSPLFLYPIRHNIRETLSIRPALRIVTRMLLSQILQRK
jgi:hypothetical protein